MRWWERLYTKPEQPDGPDRVERLLSSCRAYYRAGDTDIAVLLLREAEQTMTSTARAGDTLVGRAGER